MTDSGKRQETDYSKLEAVNLSFRRPAKWYMYIVKRVLRERKEVEIKARPNAAAQVVRVAEALKRLGYVNYVSYQTKSVVNTDVVSRFIVVKVQKTANFDKLYDEREEERKTFIENQKKDETK
jgi:hypothetical protein